MSKNRPTLTLPKPVYDSANPPAPVAVAPDMAVHRYNLNGVCTLIVLPPEAQVVGLAADRTGQMFLWVVHRHRVPFDALHDRRFFEIVRTGEPTMSPIKSYVGNLKGATDNHVFEVYA